MALAPQQTALAERAWVATPDTLGRRLSNGAWTAPPHIRLLSWLLYLLGVGYLRRLTVSFPPGHGKSETTNVWFPTWDLEHRKIDRLILATYEGTFAEEWGKKVRSVIEDNTELLTVRLKGDSQAANRWRTREGGGMWTVGAGGAITGRRARLFLIDDAIKGWAEANSPSTRRDVWAWYRSVARTRLLPGGGIGIIGTRWHPEDLIGMVHESMPSLWVSLVLPALAECDESLEEVLTPAFVRRCKRDGVWLPEWHRNEGEPLWPWLTAPSAHAPAGVPWFGKEEIEEVRLELGEFMFGGLYQQHPQPLDGDLFQRESWKFADVMPAGSMLVRRWDMAATEGGGDFTAGVLMGRALDGRVFVGDAVRARLDGVGVERLIAQTAEADKERYGRVMVRLEQEPGSAGKALAEHYVRNVLPGYEVSYEPSSGDKTVRAIPFASQQQAGNVWLVRKPVEGGGFRAPAWWEWFIDEHAAFPAGRNDDTVDAACLAYADLISLSRRRSKARARSVARRSLEKWVPSPTFSGGGTVTSIERAG